MNDAEQLLAVAPNCKRWRTSNSPNAHCKAEKPVGKPKTHVSQNGNRKNIYVVSPSWKKNVFKEQIPQCAFAETDAHVCGLIENWAREARLFGQEKC